MPVEKKHNFFYRTTNQINWKYYFGIHSTNNLEDGYLGSGVVLKDAILKYGIENFHLTIIQDYPTRKEASDHERNAVTMIQVNEQNCYNVRTGGDNGYIHSDEHKRRISESSKGRIVSVETRKKLSELNLGKPKGPMHSDEQKKKWSEERVGEGNPAFGIKHSPEAIEKTRQAHLGRKATDETKDLLKRRKKEFFQTEDGDIYRKNISERTTGEKNPFFGKTHTEESKQEVSQTKISKYGSDEFVDYTQRGIQTRKENGTLKHSESTKNQISKSLVGNDFCKGHPCSIDGIIFRTSSEAIRTLNISGHTFLKRLRSNDEMWKDWFYLDHDDPKVVLIRSKPRKPREMEFGKRSIIHGVIFNKLKDVCNFYQITTQTVTSRINSPKDKWKDWQYYNEEKP